MSRTSLIRAKGVRDGTEQKVTENYAATLAQNLYDKEKRERIAADDTLQENIDFEADQREVEDSQIRSDLRVGLQTEEAARKNADLILDGKITNEATARTNADNALQQNIDVEAAAIAILNGNDTIDGSVSKKIKDAINAFATAITTDGTVNTYKEVLDWIAEHGADFAALVGQVNTLEGMAHTHGNKEVLDGISAADITKWNLIDGIKEFDMQAIYSLYGGLRLLYRLLEGNVLGINLYDGGYVSMTEIERTIDGGNINDTEIRTTIDGGNVTDIIETIGFATPAEIIAEWNKEEE